MDVLRTPEERFADLPGYPFAPHYVEVSGLRVHYIDEGPRNAAPVLLLHGEPSWSYLYRKMIPVISAAGHRCVAPDLIGFGRSDKPTARAEYTYQRHVDWMRGVLEALDLREVTLVCQDWGGLIGLRLVAEHRQRFARVVAANTFLPTGDVEPGPALPERGLARILADDAEVSRRRHRAAAAARPTLPPEVIAAYDAPFPDDSYKAGARQFPLLVPATPDDPAAAPNRAAWEVLRRWTKPFLTAFSDADPVTAGGDAIIQREIPGAHDQPHTTITGAGHFLQEDKGEELARVVVSSSWTMT